MKMPALAVMLAMLVAPAVPATAAATTLYVDCKATAATDAAAATADGSVAAPFRHIHDATAAIRRLRSATADQTAGERAAATAGPAASLRIHAVSILAA